MENDTEKKAKSSIGWLPLVGLVLVFVAITLLIMFLIGGETVVTGEFEGGVTLDRLVCESSKVTYPLFSYDNSSSKNIKINVTFEKNNKIHAISLMYKLGYSTAEEIKMSESMNHASMNLSFQKNNLGGDAFNATYGKLTDGLQFSLYATGSDINSKALVYFMLDKLENQSYTPEKVAEVYNKQGLNCEIKKQQDGK